MNIKVNFQASRLQKIRYVKDHPLSSMRWRVGHKSPLSLSRIIVNVALTLAGFWMDAGCGSAEEMMKQVHEAAADLAQKEYG